MIRFAIRQLFDVRNLRFVVRVIVEEVRPDVLILVRYRPVAIMTQITVTSGEIMSLVHVLMIPVRDVNQFGFVRVGYVRTMIESGTVMIIMIVVLTKGAQ